jgi:hypothetical protein
VRVALIGALLVVAFLAGYWLSRSHTPESEYVLVGGQIVRKDADGVKTAVGPRMGTSSGRDDNGGDTGPSDDAPPAGAPSPDRGPANADNGAAPSRNAVPPPAQILPDQSPGRIARIPSEQAAPSPQSAAAYRTYLNRDIEGYDIGILKNADMPGCVLACQANHQCRAFTFDKWNRYCFLKSDITVLSLNPRSITGIPGTVAAPPMSAGAIVMEHYRGRAFPGSGYRTLTGQLDTCETACRNDPACVAYTFQKSGTCHLFDVTGEYFPDALADSGGKVQTP